MSSWSSSPPDRTLLPYLPPPPPIRLFGLQIPIFGLFLFAAALTAYLLITLRGRRLALGPRVPEQIAGSLLLAAILGAHLTGTLADKGVAVFTTPSVLFSPSSTLSSAGGLVGAAAAGVLWVRRLRLDRLAALALADLAAYAFPFAWLVARAGCALVHDHPGRLSTSPLALSFPGGARLDCGLLELLATPPLLLLALTLSRPRTTFGASSASSAPPTPGVLSMSSASPQLSAPGSPISTLAPSLQPRPPGLLAGSMAVSYSLLRFPLDFLRATDLPTSDSRYLGLTAAQWGALPLFAAGAWCLVLVTRSSHPPGPPAGSSLLSAAVLPGGDKGHDPGSGARPLGLTRPMDTAPGTGTWEVDDAHVGVASVRDPTHLTA